VPVHLNLMGPTRLLEKITHNAATKRLLEYWQELPRAEGHICPTRDNFRMMDISEFAAQVFLLQRLTSDNICMVQSGVSVNNILGADLTGHNLLELLPQPQFLLERTYFQALHKNPCAGSVTLLSPRDAGKSYIYRSIHLPLLGTDGAISFWVGTSAILEGKGACEELTKSDQSRRKVGNLHLLEREFFDIGAGIPNLEIPALTIG